MKFKRSWLVSLCFVVLAAGVAVWLYPRLPTEVPTHWDFQGRVNGTMSRFWGASMPALTIFGLAALTWLLPVISPRRFEITPFAQVFVLVMLAVQALVLVLGVAMLLSAVGYAVAMPEIAVLGVGALYLILGNYMGKLRRNFFIGIRTPWTLASDTVWERTHRLGGWLFMLAGVLAIIGTLAGAPAWWAVVVLLAVAFIPAIYSLVIYRRRSAPD